MSAPASPFPLSPRTGGRPIAPALALSLLLHGAALGAAHWLWPGEIPPEAPPMVSVAMVPEARIAPAIDEVAPSEAANEAVAPPLPTPPVPEETAEKREPEPKIPLREIGEHAAATPWPRGAPVPPRRPDALGLRAMPAAEKTPPPAPLPSLPQEGKPSTRSKATAGTEAARAPGAAEGTRIPPRPAAGPGNPAPSYPWISRRRGEEGRVILEVAVDKQGRAREVRVTRSSGHARLDRAALEAVRNWRFVPARRGGAAVAGQIEVPIVFQLTD